MTILIPTIKELQAAIANDLVLSINAGQLDTSKQIDPTIRNSFIKGLADSMSAGFDENNDVLEQVLAQIFPKTATGIYLERWANWFGINRKNALKSTGFAVASGIALTTIPNNTALQNALGTQYLTVGNSTINAATISVVSITRTGSTVLVTTTSDHRLASGINVSITGANQTDYNVVNKTINVTGLNTFTFQIATTPATPATGSIFCSSITAYTAIIASDFGSLGNVSGGSLFNLITPIIGIDNTLYASFDGIVGGLDVESDDSLRARLLERCANFSAPFTNGGIAVFCKERVAGITRMWVKDANPIAGKTTIYFARDNDNIIPTSQQALEVKEVITNPTTGIKPANTPDSYVIVLSPAALYQDFIFSNLSPNTVDMQTAISNSLKDFFVSPAVSLGQEISLAQINNVIFSTLDSGGNQPTFTLTSPSAAIIPLESELPLLGDINYP